MFSFRRVQFENGAVVWLRPQEHDQQIGHLISEIANHRLIIQGMSVETAAAWNIAVGLFHLPTTGKVH